jgi:hypothetical protein
MAKVESRLANAFLEQLGNVNNGTARTVSIHLADFEQFVKREYHKDLDSLVEELKSGKLDLYDLGSGPMQHLAGETIRGILDWGAKAGH